METSNKARLYFLRNRSNKELFDENSTENLIFGSYCIQSDLIGDFQAFLLVLSGIYCNFDPFLGLFS